MGFFAFLFCWFLVGGLTDILLLWVFREEKEAPTKVLAWCFLLGFISPVLLLIAGIAHFFDQNEEIKNPFYKEPKKEKENE